MTQFPNYSTGPVSFTGTPLPGFRTAQVAQSTSPSRMGWAIGKNGAEAYPAAPGETIAIFDSAEPFIRIKTVDLNGKPLIFKTYRLIEEEETEAEPVEIPQIDTSQFVTKDEIAAIVAKAAKDSVDKALSEISLKPTSSKKKKGDDE